MRKRTFIRLVLVALAVLMIFAVMPSAGATPPADKGPKLDRSASVPQACNGDGAVLVANVTEDVLNVIDSGFGGNWWAHDDFHRHFQIWNVVDDWYCVSVSDAGMFTTSAGTSPSGFDTVSEGVTGSMIGGYAVMVQGTFAPGNLPTDGYLGTFDRNCDPGASSCDPYTTWINYFDGVPAWSYTYWGWRYNAGDNGTWLNQQGVSAADSGDITG